MRQAHSVVYQFRLATSAPHLEPDRFRRTGYGKTRFIIDERFGCNDSLRRMGMSVRNSSRRSFIKLAAAAPLLTQIAARNLYAQAATAIGKDPRQNVYTRLGVRTVINCRGTWTYLSGSLEFPEVRQAQVEASQYFVNMIELQRGV